MADQSSHNRHQLLDFACLYVKLEASTMYALLPLLLVVLLALTDLLTPDPYLIGHQEL